MMYSEFAEAVGCRDNDHNHKVFRDLEIMYMNSDMSKAEIYEYGKKLVDNSKSEAELKVEAEVKAEIEVVEAEIESDKHWVNYYKVRRNTTRACRTSSGRPRTAGWSGTTGMKSKSSEIASLL